MKTSVALSFLLFALPVSEAQVGPLFTILFNSLTDVILPQINTFVGTAFAAQDPLALDISGTENLGEFDTDDCNIEVTATYGVGDLVGLSNAELSELLMESSTLTLTPFDMDKGACFSGIITTTAIVSDLAVNVNGTMSGDCAGVAVSDTFTGSGVVDTIKMPLSVTIGGEADPFGPAFLLDVFTIESFELEREGFTLTVEGLDEVFQDSVAALSETIEGEIDGSLATIIDKSFFQGLIDAVMPLEIAL